MANYFNYFPLTLYTSDDNGNNLDTVTNIIARFGFESSLKENSSAFYRYDIKDGDTPESIATKYYGDPEKHWIVLLFNDIIDPQYDWPLTYPNFIKYVSEKYAANGAANATVQSGLTWSQSQNNVHSYYKLTTRALSALTVDDKTIIEKVRVTANTYANVVASTTEYTLSNGKKVNEAISKEKLTYYEYETQENETKRSIRLLKSEFVPIVMEEFRVIINPQ
jgi:hypothetical protein